jgi:hypothetical protein
MKFCHDCGAQQISNSKFCSSCGTKMTPSKLKGNAEDTYYSHIQADEVTAARSKLKVMAGSFLVTLAIFGGVFYTVAHYVNKTVDSISQSFSPNAKPNIPVAKGGVRIPVADGQLIFQLEDHPICNKNGNTQICKIHLTIANNSKTSADFFASNQKLSDSEGNLYDVDSSKDTNGADQLVDWVSLNPNFKVERYLYFQVPTSKQISELIVHDSVFSDGAGIKLS